MPARHNNSSQLVPIQDFRPLLQSESPYFNNLNRGPKDAYVYADSINKILSYGGCVSRVLPEDSNIVYSLYSIVKFNVANETISQATKNDAVNTRLGIVVTEADSEGYYVVCTFCPNFVYPSTISFVNTADAPLFLDETVAIFNLKEATGSGGTLGNVAVARITGTHSIFFSGTLRHLTSY